MCVGNNLPPHFSAYNGFHEQRESDNHRVSACSLRAMRVSERWTIRHTGVRE